MLALKCLSVDQLTIRTFNDLNSAMATALQVEGLNDGSLSTKTCRLGVTPVGIFVANPPVGHFNPSAAGSELQPPPDPLAAPDKVAGTGPESPQPETPEAMIKDELRRKNARLRQKINWVLEHHPELRDATDELVLRQGAPVRAGTPFPERIQANLQARAIIERHPDLEHLFDE